MKRTVGHIAIALALALALAAGCTRARVPVTSAAEASRAGAAELAAQPTPRQLVRRGRIAVTVARVDEARRRFEGAAAALGAQVARLEASGDDRAEYLLRVPPDRLDAAMDSAAALGEARDRTVSAEDVTEQVVDAEGRLAALRASRDRLRQLMERAGSVAEVVTVERELARVQAELESLEGRLNSLRGRVALAELSVRLERRRVLGPLGLLAVGVTRVIEKLFVWR